MEKTSKIILLEDHHVVRKGIRILLEKEDDFSVIAEVTDGRDLFPLIEGGTIPDIIIADINLPGMDGLEVTLSLKNRWPEIKVVILSMFDNESFIAKAFKAGASAYVFKSVSTDELMFAIRHVLAGGEYVSAEAAVKLVRRIAISDMPGSRDETRELALTERDLEVLSLIADGFTNHEMAEKLFTSRRTVEGYRQSLMNKTGTRNTAALVKYAVFNGLIN